MVHMHETQEQQQFTPHIATITVTRDRSVGPYIDTFAITPQNIIERNHGSLVGFFRIYDTSEDSAYIANFLTSILKKEFYASTRRGTEASLEAALAKVNMALGELARHNSTQWIGKVDGAVCAFTPTSVCFSACGHARVLLFRNQTLSQISLPADDAAHVLSTFSDIACGALHQDDTFIIASRELADVLPHAECERACRRYARDAREQLFRTALVNQTDGSCVHLVDIAPARAAITHRSAAFDMEDEKVSIPENVFSATTFATTTPSLADDAPQTDTEDTQPHSHTADITSGHIYLQGDEADTQRTPFGDILMEHTTALRRSLRRSLQTSRENINALATLLRTRGAAAARHTARRAQSAARAAAHSAQRVAHTTATTARAAAVTAYARIKDRAPRRAPQPPARTTTTAESPASTTNTTTPPSSSPAPQQSPTAPRVKQSFAASASHAATKQAVPPEAPPTQRTTPERTQLENFLARSTSSAAETHTESIADVLGKVTESIGAHTAYLFSRVRSTITKAPQLCAHGIRAALPHPRRVVTRLRALNTRDRIIAFGIIAAIIVVPLLFTKVMQRTQTQHIRTAPATEQASPTNPDVPRDATSIPITRTHTLHTDRAVHTLLSLRGELYAIAPRTITHITNATTKKTYNVPTTYGTVRDAVAMDDLNMLILRTDKDAIISFTPQGATKFAKNKIVFPAGLSIDSMAVYRTYLYFFDSNGNDIYRYPRATGGFGAAVDWLTDHSSFTTPRSVVIDGTIYMADDSGAITAFFKHKKASFPRVSLTPPLHADALFTANEDAPLYVLDRTTQRIVALSKKDGIVIRNVTNSDFGMATAFTVDERLSIITALLDDGTVATYRY